MKQILIIFFLLALTNIVCGQTDSTELFEGTKGKWPLPIPKYLKIYDNEVRKHFTCNQFDSTLRIITDSSFQVTAVHDGTVVALIETEGEYTVLTKFGKYFIAYSKLSKPKLLQGDFIKVGQKLGQLMKDESEDNYTLEIVLSKGAKELSAKKWIAW